MSRHTLNQDCLGAAVDEETRSIFLKEGGPLSTVAATLTLSWTMTQTRRCLQSRLFARAWNQYIYLEKIRRICRCALASQLLFLVVNIPDLDKKSPPWKIYLYFFFYIRFIGWTSRKPTGNLVSIHIPIESIVLSRLPHLIQCIIQIKLQHFNRSSFPIKHNTSLK